MEEWRDISGYEGKYQVSNFGNVRSTNFMKKGITVIMKQSISYRNPVIPYYRICLSKKSKSICHYVHILVASAFLSSRPSAKHTVDHIDRNGLNNNLTNLKWSSKYEQNLNRTNPGSNTGESNIHFNKNSKFLVNITRNNIRFQKNCDSLQEAIVARDSFLLECQNDKTSSNT